MSKGKMTWTSLEAIRLWGAPTEIDGTPLTLTQARVLMGVVEKNMDEARHKKAEAVTLAVVAFKAMYDKTGDGWVAKEKIELAGHGVTVRSKFHRTDQRERIMAKVRRGLKEKQKN